MVPAGQYWPPTHGVCAEEGDVQYEPAAQAVLAVLLAGQY
jgi:hypothetical protein